MNDKKIAYLTRRPRKRPAHVSGMRPKLSEPPHEIGPVDYSVREKTFTRYLRAGTPVSHQ